MCNPRCGLKEKLFSLHQWDCIIALKTDQNSFPGNMHWDLLILSQTQIMMKFTWLNWQEHNFSSSRAQESCKVGICMENSAVVEHVKLCISTIPARAENSQRLAGSEGKVEQIHTLSRPKNSSLTRSSLWKWPYGKFGFNKVMPIWKKWHSHPRSHVRLQVHFWSHPASSPPGPETVPVPILGPTHACALLQPFTGCAGHKDLQNQGGTWCNTLLLMGRKILHVFAALQVGGSFQTGAETLVYYFTVPYTGFLFSSL